MMRSFPYHELFMPTIPLPASASRWFSRHLLALMLLAFAAGPAQPADVRPLPTLFAQLVPPSLGAGLQLVQLRRRCEGCEPWRMVDFHSNDTLSPVRREKVSVQAGVTAIYAYPGTDDFANVKIEQSMPGRYAQDRQLVIDAISHEFRRKKERVGAHLGAHPEIRDKVRQLLPAGKEPIEFEQLSRDGIEVVAYTENVIGLTSATISQIHFFVPEREVIVTAYLVRQKHPKFADIGEFLHLRADFIRAWTAHLARRAGPLLPVGGGAGDHAGDQQRQGGGLEAVRPAPLPQETI